MPNLAHATNLLWQSVPCLVRVIIPFQYPSVVGRLLDLGHPCVAGRHKLGVTLLPFHVRSRESLFTLPSPAPTHSQDSLPPRPRPSSPTHPHQPTSPGPLSKSLRPPCDLTVTSGPGQRGLIRFNSPQLPRTSHQATSHTVPIQYPQIPTSHTVYYTGAHPPQVLLVCAGACTHTCEHTQQIIEERLMQHNAASGIRSTNLSARTVQRRHPRYSNATPGLMADAAPLSEYLTRQVSLHAYHFPICSRHVRTSRRIVSHSVSSKRRSAHAVCGSGDTT